MQTKTLRELINLAFTLSGDLCTWRNVTGLARTLTVAKCAAVMDELTRRLGEATTDALMNAFEAEFAAEGKRREALPFLSDFMGDLRPGSGIALARNTRAEDPELEGVFQQVAKAAEDAGVTVSLHSTTNHDNRPPREVELYASAVGVLERDATTPSVLVFRLLKNRHGEPGVYTIPNVPMR